jgi:hypothetical protein
MIEGRYLVDNCNNTAKLNVRWTRDSFCFAYVGYDKPDGLVFYLKSEGEVRSVSFGGEVWSDRIGKMCPECNLHKGVSGVQCEGPSEDNKIAILGDSEENIGDEDALCGLALGINWLLG